MRTQGHRATSSDRLHSVTLQEIPETIAILAEAFWPGRSRPLAMARASMSFAHASHYRRGEVVVGLASARRRLTSGASTSLASFICATLLSRRSPTSLATTIGSSVCILYGVLSTRRLLRDIDRVRDLGVNSVNIVNLARDPSSGDSLSTVVAMRDGLRILLDDPGLSAWISVHRDKPGLIRLYSAFGFSIADRGADRSHILMIRRTHGRPS